MPTRSRLRARIGRLLLAAASVLLTLVAFEAGLRGWWWLRDVGRHDALELVRRAAEEVPPEDVDVRGVAGVVAPSIWPDVVYELRPNLRGRFRGEPFSTNRHGLRGPEVDRDKPAGTFRIVGLGDSFMFGWGVGQEETYLRLLEARLDERAGDPRRFEVLNFAAPGYNTAMEAALYEHRARYFDPDLVLVHFVGNDFGMPHFLQPPRSLEPRSWYVVELVRAALALERRVEPELLPRLFRGVDDEIKRSTRRHYRYMRGAGGYRRAMRRLVAAAREDDVPVAILVMGEGGPERQVVVEVGEELGVPIVDALPYFGEIAERLGVADDRRAFRRAFTIPGDGHPTPLGHEAYAAALLEELPALGLLPEAASP